MGPGGLSGSKHRNVLQTIVKSRFYSRNSRTAVKVFTRGTTRSVAASFKYALLKSFLFLIEIIFICIL